MADEPASVNVSLISHTNAGKTTLTRTLLRRDVGEVRDAPHVTDTSTAYVMIETGDGSALRLWDTPGFGDTARLLRRLKHSGNALGWLLTQVWDRYTDRPFWCSQAAVRNVKDEADVVLYLVNAAESPADAVYVGMELEILQWTGKPVVLLLNQTGPPRPHEAEAAEVDAWRAHVAKFGCVRAVLPLDAFARCWVQEDALLAVIGPLLPKAKQEAYARLQAAWEAANARVFCDAMAALASQLVDAARDEEALPDKSIGARVLERLLDGGPDGRRATDRRRAMAALAERLDARVRAATDRLIVLHRLQGHAAREALQRLADDYASTQPVDEGFAALLGGFVSGAASGLAADLASGGATFGAAALGGGLLGALGAGGIARAYNVVAGRERAAVRWADDFLVALVRSALLRYLAVAHYGRGRGEYAGSEHPAFWRDLVAATVESRRAELAALLDIAREPEADPQMVHEHAEALFAACAETVLAALYPGARVRRAGA